MKTLLTILSIGLFLLGCKADNVKSTASAAENHQSARKIQDLKDNWRFQLDIRNIGEKNGWFKADFDRNDWAKVTVPEAWDCYETALRGYEGIGWYAATINPADFDPQ